MSEPMAPKTPAIPKEKKRPKRARSFRFDAELDDAIIRAAEKNDITINHAVMWALAKVYLGR